MDKAIDFAGLAQELLSQAQSYLPSWLSGGKFVGKKFQCGSLGGEEGQSLKVDLHEGYWIDHATDEKGGDLISLYAAIHRIGQGDAAKRLLELVGRPIESSKPIKKEVVSVIGAPPKGADKPNFFTLNYQNPVGVWTYVNHSGDPIFYIARYHDAEGKKQFLPWTWDLSKRCWVKKGFPEPRPLYNLSALFAKHEKTPGVLIVEGEKAADAATKFAGHKYVVTTWPNGSNSIAKADWTVLKGRNVLIWPDADKPGIQAAYSLAERLHPICKSVKILAIDITVKDGLADGYDAADFHAEHPEDTWEKFLAWAIPIARVYEPKKAELAVQEQPPIEAYNEDAEPPFTGASQPVTFNTQINVQKSRGKDVEVSGSFYAFWTELGLTIQKNGSPPAVLSIALTVFEKVQRFQGTIWFDEFHQNIFMIDDGSQKHPMKDKIVRDLTIVFQREFGLLRFDTRLVNEALKTFAHKHVRNEPRDWMDTLVWDGKPRLDTFCPDYFGCEDTPYSRAVSKNWWISMVARIYQPGCKVDTMLILEGGQGVKKSTAFEIIGGEWYASIGNEVADKDFVVNIQGKMLIELAELDSFVRGDAATIKRVLSTATDRHCFKYAIYAEDLRRRGVFVGTTNETSYLKDVTGARRFWPIEVNRDIDQDSLTANREQLFAEAVARFKKGETWWELPIDEAAEQQERRREADVWEDDIRTFLIGKANATTKEVAKHLEIDLNRIDRKVENRIGKCMRALGWKSQKVRRASYLESEPIRAWVSKDPNYDMQLEVEFK